LAAGDIPVVQADRGGQVTYHGPGQIVAYPLLDIGRSGVGVRVLVTAIEEAIINVLDSCGISGERLDNAPGVYVDGAKIASIGLRVRRRRTFHGLAFNVDMDLEPFQRINPCGFQGLQVTRLSAFCDLSLEEVENRLVHSLAAELGSFPAPDGLRIQPGRSLECQRHPKSRCDLNLTSSLVPTSWRETRPALTAMRRF
jgi:lipoyl(octanoyl) transferase